MRRLIAEIGSCNGDLSLAIDTALAALDAGAWKVKGQMYDADRLVTTTASSYGKPSITETRTQYEAFQNALTYDEWYQVSLACDGRFFASVFDLEACVDYPYDWIKIASADITYRGLIEAAAATDANLIMSTGAARLDEIHRARSWIPEHDPTMLVCTLSYPTEPHTANVRRVSTLRTRYRWQVGYSDHTRGTAAANLAFDLGATMVEKHFTIRPGTGGDHDFAIGPDDVHEIRTRIDPVSEAINTVYGGSYRIGPRHCEVDARVRARRSIHATVDIPADTVITEDMVTVIRPTGGIEPYQLEDLIGTHTVTGIKAGCPVMPEAVAL